MASVDNKRVAKNAIALTFRMVLATLVGLYTSRVVLEALGVDDYGIYGVIGGVVGMASFLNSSMAGATSRFITFELGRGNAERLRTIFSSALIIHVIIALIVAILAETVGLWFVNCKMNFPADRMFAVNVLYQFTILSMFITFTQVPYSAAIIAHGRMSIYAYFEILNVVLKLLIVYLLLIVNSDRLIFYAALLSATNLLMAVIYRFYCLHHFPECHFKITRDKPTITAMLKFAGFDLYGHMCVIAKNHGQPIILNLFFGVVANAAASIALTITGAVCGFTSSILQAFRPQIIKQYSIGKIDQCETAARRAAQFTLLGFSAIAIPVVIETPAILKLWLGQIPQYSVEFVRIIIISSLFSAIININNACIHATGDIKNISFISGTAYLLCPVFSFLWMRNEGPVVAGYIIDALMLFIVTNLGFFFISKQIPEFAIGKYILSVYRSLFTLCLSLFSIVLLIRKLQLGYLAAGENEVNSLHIFLQLISSTLISLTIVVAFAWTIALDKGERKWAFAHILNIIHRFRQLNVSKIKK